ncbi:MAG TPA: DUF3592 domain-containing protein [Terracidiphilus sp.]|nr:DUF3592 domain-containing protein [Terracidiphilus sp.]
MTPSIASFLMLRGHVGVDPFYVFVLLIVATLVGVLVVVGWGMAKDRLERTRCRNWPTVSASVDIVSVAYCEPGGSPALYLKSSSYNPYYRATLTYSYNNPEQQMGDYSRDFGKKEDAETWANSYKGETVKVHLDPRDPTNSVLLEEDL